MDFMSELIEALDGYIGLTWETSLQQSKDKTYWTFSVHNLSLLSTGAVLTLFLVHGDKV